MLCALVPAFPAQAAVSANIKIGDYVQMGTYYGKPILWRCVDIDDNGPLMLSDKILFAKAMDAKGDDKSGSHSRGGFRPNNGSNYWPDSNMRSWLNSDADAGNVQWLCGNPPDAAHFSSPYNAYDQEAGFLHNFTQDELDAVKEVTHKTLLSQNDMSNMSTGTELYANVEDIKDAMSNYDKAYAEDVQDKIFLPDVKQVYDIYNKGEILGADYYIGEPTAECVENDEDKTSGLTFGKKWNYALRTPVTDQATKYNVLASNGKITSTNAHISTYAGIRPMFYLEQDADFKSGSGAADYPYSMKEDAVKIGEYVQMGTYYGKPIIWRCVDIDEHGPLMMSDKIISAKPVDAAGDMGSEESSHKRNTNRNTWGSNFWPDSNMRSWLNSDADAGQVEWLCGNPPASSSNAYDREAGFLHGFTQDELNAVKEVTHKTLLAQCDISHKTTGTEFYINVDDIKDAMSNYDNAYAEDVQDKIFLPDSKQAYDVYKNGEILGADYYIGEPTAECVEHGESMTKSFKVGSKWHYILRTPVANQDGVYIPNTKYNVLTNSGKITRTTADVSNYGGIRPMFYLAQDVSFKSGKGTQSYPYSISGEAKRVQFGGDSSIDLSANYGEGLTADLSEYVKYENDIETAGRFTYAIEGENTIGASLSGETLTIPNSVGAGDYVLTVKATEKVSEYSLASVDTYGYEPVTLTINVKIEKIAPTATVQANELVYKNADQYLVTGKTNDGTLVYRLNDKDGEYSESLPVGNEAGDYTVWYKVLGDANHTDSEPQSMTVSIKNIVSIKIDKEPNNTTVIEGMPFDATGLVVIADCGNGETYEAFGYTLSDYDTSNPGEQTVTVTYGGQTATFNITVAAKTLTGIELTHRPDRLTYYQGDKIDITGMVITASYNNNTSEVIDNEECTVSELTETVGEQTVTVTYNDKTVEFTVAVLGKPAPTETVATPLIETADFYGGKRVIISCATDGADIYYTTDGTDPTESSNKYTSPIELTETTQVKAIAVKAEMSNSSAASAEVKVEKVAKPVVSVPVGEVKAGTTVKLLCTTPGAEIYYSIGEPLTEDHYALYTDPIVITEDTTIEAAAAKRGCVRSESVTFAYTVAPSEDPSDDDRALIGIDSALTKPGNTIELPVYMYYESGVVSDYRIELTIDRSKFEYSGFESGDSVPASALSVTVTSTESDSKITVRAAGEGIQSGIACTLKFKVKDDTEEGDYIMPVTGEVNDSEGKLIDVYYWDGEVSVLPSDTYVTADAYLADSDFYMIENVEDLKGDVTAWVLANSLESPESGEAVSADILIALYDKNGALVTMSEGKEEVYGDYNLFSYDISVPENAEIGSVKLMAWDNMDTTKPLMEAVPVL